MARTNTNPHGIGNLVVKINQAFENKFGKKLVVEETGEINNIPDITFDNKTHDVSSELGQPYGMVSNGEKLIVADFNNYNLYQYDFSVPWGLTELFDYDGVSYDILDQGQAPTDMATNGETLLVDTFDGLHQYSMDPWDLSTLSYDGNSFQFSESSAVSGIASDGDTLIARGEDSKFIEYEFGESWDLSTLSYTGTEVDSFNENEERNPCYSDGDVLLTTVSLNSQGYVRQYDFGAKWDLSTLSYSGLDLPVGREPSGLVSNGRVMIVADATGIDLRRYSYDSKLVLPQKQR